MVLLTVIYSVMARPFGNKFGIGVMGQNFDFAELAEPEKFKEFVYAQTGRTDIEIGEFSWLSYFRCIFLDLADASET